MLPASSSSFSVVILLPLKALGLKHSPENFSNFFAYETNHHILQSQNSLLSLRSL